MEIIIKSEIFKDGYHHRKFESDYQLEAFTERHIKVDTEHVKGSIKEMDLNGIFIISRNLNAPSGYSYNVKSNFNKFKLHFSLTGDYRFINEDSCQSKVDVPHGHYNLFYLPKAKSYAEAKGSPQQTFEIFFTEEFIKRTMGSHYAKSLERIKQAQKRETTFVFWKQSNIISHHLNNTLEAIINCNYTAALKKSYLQHKITSLLLEIIVEANNSLTDDLRYGLSKSDLDNLERVGEYIKDHLNESLSIKLLASKEGINESKLKNGFRKLFGTTVFRYITRLRMERAYFLLRSDGLSVAQAAYEVGYTNPQHFAKAFKRTYGYLPRTIKK